uniref:Peptidase S1 domain-containing protein n=1 Tax=Periophthalmus magnuspinnatus TaxID=409849 RepID=A0A3B3ZUI5_9GOBI
FSIFTFTVKTVLYLVFSVSVCGSAPLNAKTKIVGGEDAIPGSWPWQCSLFGSHFCGGSLINDQQQMLTSHVCTQLSNPNEVTRTVTRIICHPSYDEDTNDNDICLLKLSRSVSFDSYIRPVCLAGTGNAPSAGTNVWVTGWGTINSGQDLPFPQRLQEVNVPVVSRLVCDVSYTNVDITNNMLCAGRAGKDSCQGDSGGPLVLKMNGSWVLMGVVSFGIGCGLPQFPGVYTQVSRYQTWISGRTGSDTSGFMDSEGNLSSAALHLSMHLSLLLRSTWIYSLSDRL